MADRYQYSAYTYVNEWLGFDRAAASTLSGESETESARLMLVKLAQHYGVIRGFRKSSEEIRLQGALSALWQIERPISADDAKGKVKSLVSGLHEVYGCELWSAASKFLWMRFQTPVVMYDELTWRWMKLRHPTIKTWDDFYDCWREEYTGRREEIGGACDDLLNIRRFMRANDVPDAEFRAAVSSEWFRERVFDHFMQNEVSSDAGLSVIPAGEERVECK